MKKIIIPAIAALAFSASVSAATVKELEPRVETLEYQSYDNYFSFSGRLENQYEHIKAINNNESNEEAGYDYFSSLFQFNIMAQPNDRLTFFGRLSMTKYWNDATNEGTYKSITVARGKAKGEPIPYVERAFINYKLTDSLTLSAGRLPTVDGTPTQMRMGKSSMGSYPALSYSAILDGVALTHAAKIFDGVLKSRVVFTPVSFIDHGVDRRTSPVETKDSNGDAINTNIPMLAVMSNYEKFRTGFADRMEFMVQAMHMKGAEMGGSPGKTFNSGPPLGEVTTYDSYKSDIEFDLTKILSSIELNNLFKSNFDFAGSVAWSKALSRGTGYAAAQVVKAGQIYAGGKDIGGLFTDSNKASSTGWAYLMSVRYNATSNFKLGYEFMHATDKTWLTPESNRRTTNFYSTPGSTGHHGYVNYRFDDNLAVLTGYTHQQKNTQYTNGLFGDPQSKDETVHSVYTNLIATF